jgi:hypothetical protein
VFLPHFSPQCARRRKNLHIVTVGRGCNRRVRVNDMPNEAPCWINPEQPRVFFMISKPQHRLPLGGEIPLSGALHFIGKQRASMVERVDNRGGRAMHVLRSQC